MTDRQRQSPGGGPRPIAVVSGARAAAAAALARVLDDGVSAQPALHSVLSSHALSERDRALCTELFYGTLRLVGPLEKSLLRSADKPGRGLDERIRPHLLIAAYQLQHLAERVPAHAVVNEAVDAVGRTRPGLEGFANALLRRLGSPLSASLRPDAPLEEIADAWGVPHALARAVVDGLPAQEHAAAIAALSARPATWAMCFAGPPPGTTPHRFVPGCHVLPGGKVTEVAGFADGDLLVMEPGTAICALAVAAIPGQTILDLCAAPGAKTMLLAHVVGEQGKIIAVEQSAKRATRITDNADRMAVRPRVEVRITDVLALQQQTPVDAVLLDAPCSGFGTTRRKPEIKLRRTMDDVDKAAVLQAKLLAHAARFVKKGGVLVYSVCSPMPQEGRQQVEAFVREHRDFAREDLRTVLPWLPHDAVDEDGQARLLPHAHDTDAFFIARLRRQP